MLVKVIRRERERGRDLRPGDIIEVSDADAAPLVARGIVRAISQQMQTNLAAAAIPAGARLLVKNPRG